MKFNRDQRKTVILVTVFFFVSWLIYALFVVRINGDEAIIAEHSYKLLK